MEAGVATGDDEARWVERAATESVRALWFVGGEPFTGGAAGEAV